MAAGKDVILEIEIQGALNIKKKFPDALLVFIVPPTAEDLKKRLTGRGTESAEVIEKRLRRAAEESDGCFCKEQQARQYAEPPHRKRIHHCNGNFAVQCVGRDCIPLHCGYDFRVKSVCRSALCA